MRTLKILSFLVLQLLGASVAFSSKSSDLFQSVKDKDYLVLNISRSRQVINVSLNRSQIGISSSVERNVGGRISISQIKEYILAPILQVASRVKCVIFVVFNEYFFDKNYFKEEAWKDLLNVFNDATTKHPNLVFFVNGLHDISKENIDFAKQLILKTPTDLVADDLFYWSICCGDLPHYVSDGSRLYNAKQIKQENKEVQSASAADFARAQKNQADEFVFVSNDTVVIYNRASIVSHRKCTYYDEFKAKNSRLQSLAATKLQQTQGSNPLKNLVYVHGDGSDTVLNESDAGRRFLSVAKLETCWDVQKHIRGWRRFLIESDPRFCNNLIEKQIGDLKRKLPQTSYDNAHLIIIQSDYTNVGEVLQDFPDGVVIVQSDPVAPGVFLIEYPDDLAIKIKALDDLNKKLLQDHDQMYQQDIQQNPSNREQLNLNLARAKSQINKAIRYEKAQIIKHNAMRITKPVPLIDQCQVKLSGISDYPIVIDFQLCAVGEAWPRNLTFFSKKE